MKSNPFPVQARFDLSCTVTFAVPGEEVRRLLPPCLEPDVFDDRWGFVAVALVQTRRLRPKGFPAFLGSDFLLIGYRLFVRYRSVDGRRLRGLYILRSETDSRRMVMLGNLFTPYRYVLSDARLFVLEEELVATSQDSGLRIAAHLASDEALPLPAGSPLGTWETARRFSGPLPFTFSYDEERGRVVIIEGKRTHWHPAPVGLLEVRVPFLDTIGFSRCLPANAFLVKDVDYEWKRGRTEPWTHS